MFSGQYSPKKTTIEFNDKPDIPEEQKIINVDYQDGIKP